MALSTFSKFYLPVVIDSTNRNLNFSEGGGELLAQIEPGTYTLSQLPTAIKTALDAAGALTYTVTVSSRADRFIQISSTASFDLLTNTGSQAGTSAYSDLGFSTAADLTGASSYTSSSAIGFEYRNQFLIQNYVAPEDFEEKIDPSVNESASGVIEVVSYGTRQFIEMDLKFITNRADVADGKIILYNSRGVEDARTFMQGITTKDSFEFMPDRDDSDTFYIVKLERTVESSIGTSYKLKELVKENIIGVYDIGKLTLRVV